MEQCPHCEMYGYTPSGPCGQIVQPTIFLCGSREDDNGEFQTTPACREVRRLKDLITVLVGPAK